MKIQRSAWIGAVGVVLIALSSLLPISSQKVLEHTSNAAVRGLLSDEALALSADSPAIVSFLYNGPTGLEANLRRQVALHPGLELSADRGAGRIEITVEIGDNNTLTTRIERTESGAESEPRMASTSHRIGDWLSLLPPLLALFLALALQRVSIALLIAVIAGCWVITNDLLGLGAALLRTWTHVLWPTLSDSFNLEILGFTLALVGMVAVIGRMGGTRGLVLAVSRFAKGPRSTQLITASMGTAVFFDDYANTVVVGTTGRRLTDSNKISREKLAYIVDSTSAPVAGIALVSTWIGYEVGLFDSLLSELSSVEGISNSGYGIFFDVLPLRFYCIFALALVFLSAALKRDLGPMIEAEARTRAGGSPRPEGDSSEELAALEKPGVAARWQNAVLPIALVLGAIFTTIVMVGSEGLNEPLDLLSFTHWREMFSVAADDIGSILLWSSLAGGAFTALLALGQGLLSPREIVTSYFQGVYTLLGAATILIMAWSIKSVCEDVGTGMTLVALVGDHVPALLLPLLVFALAGVIAFSTGTSWGTMALLLPVAAPLAASISGEAVVVALCLGAVLDGAIWGDHCSPISDTTVLSSTASGCPHLAHVRTQLPYASLAMLAAALCGYLGHAAGLPVAACYLAGGGILLVGLLWWGKDPDAVAALAATASPGEDAS